MAKHTIQRAHDHIGQFWTIPSAYGAQYPTSAWGVRADGILRYYENGIDKEGASPTLAALTGSSGSYQPITHQPTINALIAQTGYPMKKFVVLTRTGGQKEPGAGWIANSCYSTRDASEEACLAYLKSYPSYEATYFEVTLICRPSKPPVEWARVDI